MSDSKDQKTISISLISTRLDEQGTVFYIIRVLDNGRSWLTSKRYSSFETLQTNILASNSRGLPHGTELPPKKLKLFVSHVSPAFIEERRVLLENFLRRLAGSDIGRTEVFRQFLDSDRVEEDSTTLALETESKQEKQMPSDVEITGASIPSTRTMTDHVLYQIDLENNKKRQSFSRWTVLKRFNQIYDMDAAIRADFVNQPSILGLMPPLPRRSVKLFTSHVDDAFIESRRVLLENYLNRMIGLVEIVRNKNFLVFLGVSLE